MKSGNVSSEDFLKVFSIFAEKNEFYINKGGETRKLGDDCMKIVKDLLRKINDEWVLLIMIEKERSRLVYGGVIGKINVQHLKDINFKEIKAIKVALDAERISGEAHSIVHLISE